MAGNRGTIGAGISRKITSRLENQISRRAMADGGEVYSGELASKALKAVGARAMTVDQSIIVDKDFNPTEAEDAALYAHEQVHVRGSGGEAGHSLNDAEETAARAAEAMVFHRMTGGYEGGYDPGKGGGGHPGDQQGQDRGAGVPSSQEKPDNKNLPPDAERGYWALIDQGYQHSDVVYELSRQAMGALEEQGRAGNDRHKDKKGWY